MARAKSKVKTKPKMITMRVTQAQWDYLNEMADRVKAKTGIKITRASIILRLMEYGYPFLQKEYPKIEIEDLEKLVS